ncbi:IucA/IucC family C-terminal-domain containing protein [Alcaligenaceae bacterium B3P038]|nr:IucA/IucC family C-terminal-domain containing protein [Alcaligenaceae bacterium B3P038]
MGPFDRAQWQVLSQSLQLARAADRDVDYAIDTQALLDVERCRKWLDSVGPMIGSPSRVVTASLLAKRIAFLVTGPSLYAMSAFDLGLNLARDNCITEYAHRDGLWQSRMVLKDLAVDRPGEGRRAEWRERVMRRVFAEHLTPLWATLHEACGIAPRILWENTAVRVFSLYERRLAKLDSERLRCQARDDFDYLMHRAPASVFGLPEHPLVRFFSAASAVAARDVAPTGAGPDGAPPRPAVRFRKTCCLYFMATDPAEYCSTCPLIRPGVVKPV